MHCIKRWGVALIPLSALLVFLAVFSGSAWAQESRPVDSEQLYESLQINKQRIEEEIVRLDRQIAALESRLESTDPKLRLLIGQLGLSNVFNSRNKRDRYALAQELRAVRAAKQAALEKITLYLTGAVPKEIPFTSYAELMVYEESERRIALAADQAYAEMQGSGEYLGDEFDLRVLEKLPSKVRRDLVNERQVDRHLAQVEKENERGRNLPPEPAELTRPPQGCDTAKKKEMIILKGRLPESVDLRARLPEVRNQGTLGACEIFTVIAGFEALPNVPRDLSERYLYTEVLQATQWLDQPLDDRGASPVIVFNLLARQGLCEERDCRWNNSMELPQDFSVQGKSIRLKEFAYFTQADEPPAEPDNVLPVTSLLRPLLANGYLPLIGIHADRTFLEDWERFEKPLSGINQPHALMVVGYGFDRSPFSDTFELYYLIRDSSAPGVETNDPEIESTDKISYIHYKVAAADLEQYMKGEEGIYVVLAADVIEPSAETPKDH